MDPGDRMVTLLRQAMAQNTVVVQCRQRERRVLALRRTIGIMLLISIASTLAVLAAHHLS
jgi:hypothetical protein